MDRFFSFLKRNIMFVIILVLILSITAGHDRVSKRQRASRTERVSGVDQPGDDEDPQDTAPSGGEDEEGEPVQISSFSGSVVNDDTVLLTWEVENSGEQDVVSSALYYISQDGKETWLADVTNHTSYQLSQDAYRLKAARIISASSARWRMEKACQARRPVQIAAWTMCALR